MKSQDKGLILKDRPSSPLRKGLIYLYCITNKIPKLSRPGIEMKAGSRPLLDGMAGKEAEDLPLHQLFKKVDKESNWCGGVVDTSTSLSVNPERSRGIDTSTSLSVNPERSRGIDNAYFFYYQGLYAVVSNVSTDEFSEENLKKNLADLEWIKKKANVHEKVIETVMKNSCVIPFKFGTLFNTEENLKAMLKKQIREFKDALKYLEAKEEWGVKIYCDIDKLKENLIREDKELRNIDREINSASAGKAFILKKKKVELLNTRVNRKLNDYGQLIFEKLNQHSIESRINKLLPKEVTERKEEMILNSVFLIKKNKVENFAEAESALKEIFEEMGLFLDCTGPWPPYNFCEATTYGVKRT